MTESDRLKKISRNQEILFFFVFFFLKINSAASLKVVEATELVCMYITSGQ